MTKQGLLEFDGHMRHANQGTFFYCYPEQQRGNAEEALWNVCCHWLRSAPGDRVRVGVSPLFARRRYEAAWSQACELTSIKRGA